MWATGLVRSNRRRSRAGGTGDQRRAEEGAVGGEDLVAVLLADEGGGLFLGGDHEGAVPRGLGVEAGAVESGARGAEAGEDGDVALVDAEHGGAGEGEGEEDEADEDTEWEHQKRFLR